MVNLFYEEPDEDRWVLLDRYPRRVLRRVLRGHPMIGGHQRVFLNLCAGLDRLGVSYRVNEYRHAQRHPDEPVGIIGKPFVIDRIDWKNPIVFGAAIYSHPTDDPALLARRPVRTILVPGEWMRRMCEPYWGARVAVWPVGIDTDLWSDTSSAAKDVDVLLYDKIRWRRDELVPALLDPIRTTLLQAGLAVKELRYGFYREEDFHNLLSRARAMVFICEHETQGIAYQQALSRGVPVFAWDRGGPWQDPGYFPDRVVFEPVSSVPYWDARCGSTFADLGQFRSEWQTFWTRCVNRAFAPRNYILENLTLERCADAYLGHINAAAGTAAVESIAS